MTEKEFNHIVMPLTQNIWSFAVNITGDKELSSDITQEVMLRLWDNRQQLKKVENLKSWTLKITRNLCLDWLKKQKPVLDENLIIRNEKYETDTLKEIEHRDMAGIVRKIINTLPENQKEVIILREIEELEFEEIAEITGLEINNIRVLLSRARSKVREKLMPIAGLETVKKLES